MGFPRQEYWSGLPFLFPRDLSDPGIEPRSPALQAVLYHLSHQGTPTPVEPIFFFLKTFIFVTEVLKYLEVETVSFMLHGVEMSGCNKPFGEGSGNPLQYSCLEHPMDGGAW